MNTVFARAFVVLSLVALPAASLASTKVVSKHHGLAKKEPTMTTTKRKAKRHGHKATPNKGVASGPASAKEANTASVTKDGTSTSSPSAAR